MRSESGVPAFGWLDRLRQDVVYAVRRLRRAPGFTLGATAVLALGVGVNLAEVHIFNAVLFPDVHVRDAGSMRVFSRQSRNRREVGFPYAAVDFYRRNNNVLSAIVTESYGGQVALDDDPAL